MHDSAESDATSVCHTVIMTSSFVCQSPVSSVCHTINMMSVTYPVCLSYHQQDKSVHMSVTPLICQLYCHID